MQGARWLPRWPRNSAAHSLFFSRLAWREINAIQGGVTMLFARSLLRFACLAAVAATSAAQDYPNKPIRFVTSAAGGGTDFVARLVAQESAAGLGQPLIVDNRPAIALGDILPKAPPNGYTLMVGGESL